MDRFGWSLSPVVVPACLHWSPSLSNTLKHLTPLPVTLPRPLVLFSEFDCTFHELKGHLFALTSGKSVSE